MKYQVKEIQSFWILGRSFAFTVCSFFSFLVPEDLKQPRGEWWRTACMDDLDGRRRSPLLSRWLLCNPCPDKVSWMEGRGVWDMRGRRWDQFAPPHFFVSLFARNLCLPYWKVDDIAFLLRTFIHQKWNEFFKILGKSTVSFHIYVTKLQNWSVTIQNPPNLLIPGFLIEFSQYFNDFW